METRRIEQTQQPTVQGTDTKPAQRRIDLHQKSGFENSAGRHDLSALDPGKQDDIAEQMLSTKPRFLESRLANGEPLLIPLLSEADHHKLQKIYARVSPERQAEVHEMMQQYITQAHGELTENGEEASAGRFSPAFAAATTKVKKDLEETVIGKGNTKQNQAMNEQIILSVGAVEKRLLGFFQEVERRQNVRQQVRGEHTELKEMIDTWPEGEKQKFTWTEVDIDDTTHEVTLVTHKDELLTKEEAQQLAGRLDSTADSLTTIGNSDQLHLQRIVHDYQQVVQIVTSILKHADETGRGIIGNCKA